jgi:hypothetical protein
MIKVQIDLLRNTTRTGHGYISPSRIAHAQVWVCLKELWDCFLSRGLSNQTHLGGRDSCWPRVLSLLCIKWPLIKHAPADRAFSDPLHNYEARSCTNSHNKPRNMAETYPGRSSHLVARLVLMIGMICAVIAQLIGLNVQLALQNDQLGHMKDLQQRLYKQTVVALTSQKLAGNLDESIPWPAKDDARGSGIIRSKRSGKRQKSAENSRTSDVPRDAQSLEAKAFDERRKLNIQQVVNRTSHVPLNEDGQIDWNQIDHVYYYHTRKAG